MSLPQAIEHEGDLRVLHCPHCGHEEPLPVNGP